MKKGSRIICPVCGRNYLPGEIFIPNYLIGQPKYVERDTYGKILNVDGISPDNQEEYKCDGCGTDLIISCDIKFYTEVDERKNFDTPYTTKLKTGMILKED